MGQGRVGESPRHASASEPQEDVTVEYAIALKSLNSKVSGKASSRAWKNMQMTHHI